MNNTEELMDALQVLLKITSDMTRQHKWKQKLFVTTLPDRTLKFSRIGNLTRCLGLRSADVTGRLCFIFDVYVKSREIPEH
jgi:hypothetical protein